MIAPDDQGRFGGGPYGDDRLDDDFYWAAAELWLGYGTDTTRHLRTRQFADRPPPGALAGGANSRETPGWPTDPRLVGRPLQYCYLDEPTSETTNDVCNRWNAPLAAVTAALA